MEVGLTDKIFSMPSDKRTEDYITGRFVKSLCGANGIYLKNNGINSIMEEEKWVPDRLLTVNWNC